MTTPRASRRDEASFRAIYDHHHRDAVRLAWLMTGDRDQAEDIVADAITNVWVKWRQGRVDDVGPYLRRAVANGARSKLRRRYLERREATRLSGDHRGQRRHDDHTAEHDAMWTAIQALPPRQREVVVLRYYEDLSVANTAAVLGIAQGTVKSSLSRALSNLQTRLTPQLDDRHARRTRSSSA